VDISIDVTGQDTADGLRSLQALLAGEDELRGRTRLVQAAAPPGALGPLAESLAVALGPGGVSAAVAACLVTWLRQRSSDVVVRVRGGHGRTVEVSAKRVRGLDSSQLHNLARRLAGELAELDAAGTAGGAEGEDPAGGGGPAVT
jgi:membrane-associated two-gene conflict system component 1 (EACC1)